MLIPPVYISFRRRNKFQRYFKPKKKHVDEPTFESDIWGAEEKVPIPPENDDSSSESEHEGEGMSLRELSKVVNHPLTKLVEQVIRHPEDALRRLVPVNEVIKYPLVPSIKGAGFTKEEDPMVYSDANFNDAEIDEGEIEDEWMEPDAKVSKLEDSECLENFQRADRHIPSRIPETTKKYPQRQCLACRRRGIRHDTRYYCKDCSDSPALCKACFNDFNHM